MLQRTTERERFLKAGQGSHNVVGKFRPGKSPCLLGEASMQERVLGSDRDRERIHKQVQVKSSLMRQKYTVKEGVWVCSRGEQPSGGQVEWWYNWSLSRGGYSSQ